MVNWLAVLDKKFCIVVDSRDNVDIFTAFPFNTIVVLSRSKPSSSSCFLDISKAFRRFGSSSSSLTFSSLLQESYSNYRLWVLPPFQRHLHLLPFGSVFTLVFCKMEDESGRVPAAFLVAMPSFLSFSSPTIMCCH